MAWADSTNNPQTYHDNETQTTEWDGDVAQWDIIGNIVTTYWDVAVKSSYSDTTNQTQVWVDQ